MNFDKMQKRWCAGRIRQESVTRRRRGEIQTISWGLSDFTVGEWVTITTEMRFCSFRCLLNMALGQSHCWGSMVGIQ